MAYFSNSTDGSCYEAKYCDNCKNQKTDEYGTTCPIMELHFFHNGDDVHKNTLNHLIPRDEKGFNKQCSMFLPKETT